MASLVDYFTEVQRYLGLKPIDLIRSWCPTEINGITKELRSAIRKSKLIGSSIANFKGTNQAKGNQAADHFVAQATRHLPAFCQIVAATGSGYPDRICIFRDVGFAMELKATTNWDNTDGNRRVLSSSPRKLRNLIQAGDLGNPPAHMIVTVLYEDGGTVTGIRLDFLEPGSAVTVRLEASTSQRLLSSGTHHSIELP